MLSTSFLAVIAGLACMCAVGFGQTAPTSDATVADSDLKTRWKAVTSKYGEWGKGYLRERRGQICDPWRSFGQAVLPSDTRNGCAIMFIADPKDEWNVKKLPRNQQNNFQNTQHYYAAWNFDRKGLKADSLPRAPQDMAPVCYIANVSGTVVLGYEEGNGDRLLPCPGNSKAYPYTAAEILAPGADLADMCAMCYQSVCTGAAQVNPANCNGGVEIANGAELIDQATPAYHCHLTMSNEGACDYVQYAQHEESRQYNMDYSVVCGWENVREYNITQCDCTAVAGTANNCQQTHCLNMAVTAGVVCGNCGGCSTTRAYDGIFKPAGADGDVYAGSCTAARAAKTDAERRAARMMCSAGLFCRRFGPAAMKEALSSSGCVFHCANFPEDANCRETTTAAAGTVDATPRPAGSRRMLAFLGLEEPHVIDMNAPISLAHIHPDYPVIRASRATNK